ncbi:MAG: YraN family protein [Spirochaetales bacterium]
MRRAESIKRTTARRLTWPQTRTCLLQKPLIRKTLPVQGRKHVRTESTTSRGKRGEQTACDFLLQRGYEIVARNFRQKCGEIDIIGVQGERIVFVEVKAWSRYSIAELGESITREKRRRIVAASQLFLVSRPELASLQPQFDVVFVQEERVHHLQNAFAGNGAW